MIAELLLNIDIDKILTMNKIKMPTILQAYSNFI